jgi:hypothetical protein
MAVWRELTSVLPVSACLSRDVCQLGLDVCSPSCEISWNSGPADLP